MGTAEDTQVLRGIRAAERPRVDVIELEMRPRRALAAGVVDVGALLAVARKHLTTHRARHATSLPRPRVDLATRASCRAESLLLELREQRVDSCLDQHCEVPARISMAHQRPRPFELVAQLRARGQLQLVARGRQRLEPRLAAPARQRRRRARAGARHGAVAFVGAERAAGSFRSIAGTSGLGARRASSSSSSRLLLPRSGGNELFDVRLGEVIAKHDQRRQMKRAALDVTDEPRKPPDQARRVIRRNAAPSLIPRCRTQKSNIDEQAAFRWRRRSSTSTRWTTSRARSRRPSTWSAWSPAISSSSERAVSVIPTM